ncbi:MAG: alpha/beta hydrolase [Gemmatimonadota bacterium]|nr:alpha/beta hydrolase [Gemmatimonadota bacterium]
MNRRDFIRTSATFTAGTVLVNCRTADKHLIHFEVHGQEDGVPLFLGFPLMASYAEIFGPEQAAVKDGFLSRLTDRYRVLLVDYPNVGRTMVPAPAEMTPDRVYADLLSVADAAGFDRFACCGHLWGAINGLILASRSDRVSALICGTWPPLGAPYADMLRGIEVQLAEPPPHAMVILRNPDQYAQWHTFYSAMQDWPEAEVAAAINCPRIALIGSNAESSVAGIPLRLVERLREARPALEAMGWTVREIPGAETAAILDPAVMVPEMRAFLERIEG